MAAWVRKSRETAYPASQPIPPFIRAQLAGFVSEDVLNRARFKVGDDGVFNTGNVVMMINPNVAAVTLINVIVFRSGNDAAYNVSLWAHELFHVKQNSDWGVDNFAISYTRNFNDVEGPAYARENEYAAWRARSAQQPQYPYPQPGPQPMPQMLMATICATPQGFVPLAVPMPVGAQCVWFSPYGQFPGVAR